MDPLTVKVKEPSLGLFYWVVQRLSATEHSGGVNISGSDHPYPTHEAALQAGVACMKALRSQRSI